MQHHPGDKELPHKSLDRQERSISRVRHMTLQVAVFDRGKAALPEMPAPLLSIPSLDLRLQDQQSEPDDAAGNCPDYVSMDITSVSVAAAPRQLEVCFNEE